MSARSQASNRRDQPGGTGESVWVWVFIGVVVVVLGAVYGAVHLGYRLAGNDPGSKDFPPTDPWAVLFGVLDGSVTWTPECTVVLVGLLVVVFLLVLAGVWLRGRRRRRSSRVDWTANYLGRGREIEGIAAPAARETAQRLGVVSTLPGLPIGRTIGPNGQVNRKGQLYGSWEDMQILIAGPRTGKSVSFAIPAILDAPGAVLVTSNKRDIVDATRDVRAAQHQQWHHQQRNQQAGAAAGDAGGDAGSGADGGVWVFDPQGVVNEEPSWWWNPLSYVTDEVKAATLARHFAAASHSGESTSDDGYFPNAGRDLLADLLLAAALAERPITEVYRWLTRPNDDEPAEILDRHGFQLNAFRVTGIVEAADKQRSGVYGSAQQMASCLTSRAVLRWITNDERNTTQTTPLAASVAGPMSESQRRSRRHFDPASFVAAGGTLYSLSKEGSGTAGPLVTALTVAVVEAAEALATTQPGGRLAVPMVGVLDEAANVCRWHDLPDLYSHYGSRGIVLQTILQSWSQGVDVWGKSGMNKLWSAANVATYAGSVKEEDFLEMLSKLIGSYDKISRSVSTRGGAGLLDASGTQVSRQLTRERIFEVDDLAALPKGRAIVLSSGNRATILATVPWMNGPHADAVAASIKAHDPQAAQTLQEAAKSIRLVETDLQTSTHPATVQELR